METKSETNRLAEHQAEISRHCDSADKMVRVLIVDDSVFMRRILEDILTSDERITVVGTAKNGRECLEQIQTLKPDLITLDVNMPVMDGLTTLKHIMIKSPMPVLMCSTLTQEGAVVTFDALRYGAIDFISKPSGLLKSDLKDQRQTIIEKVKLAAAVKIDLVRFLRLRSSNKPIHPNSDRKKIDTIVAMGAAEGGYRDLLKIIPQLQSDLPAAIIVVLYAASNHVDAFVHYLDSNSNFCVKRPSNGELVEGGVCYIASGTEYITLAPANGHVALRVHSSPFPTIQGSINMLMFSIAEIIHQKTVGILLSGSGNDGVEGVNEISRIGGTTIIQNPDTCLIKGMVTAAIRNAQINMAISDVDMADEIHRLVMRCRFSENGAAFDY